MKYGVCCGLDLGPLAAVVGFDYIEGSVGGILKPRETQAAFEPVLAEVLASPIPMKVLNCFIPGDLKVTGPNVDLGALEAYATTAFVRAKQAGIDTIVFGSGGARAVPEGWEHERATEQIIAFLKRIAGSAEANGVTVAIEPLQRKECNIVTTVSEGAAIARAVNSYAIKLLVDCYHWAADSDTVYGIVTNGHLLRHAHLATLPERKAPGVEPFDFVPFFRALRAGGYDERLSIEGGFEKTREVMTKALKVMRDAHNAARC